MKPSRLSVLPAFAQPVTRTPLPRWVNAAACSGTIPFARAVTFTIGIKSGTAGSPDSHTISHRPPICSTGIWTRARAFLLLKTRKASSVNPASSRPRYRMLGTGRRSTNRITMSGSRSSADRIGPS
jgi:hypothetical protein